MTKVFLQPGLLGLSGGMSGWVYKRSKGKTIVGKRPERTKAPSEAELSRRERFKEAAAYGVSVKEDPALLEFYGPIAEQREITVYSLAVGDFLGVPSFKPLNLSKYEGKIGDIITIRAKDDIGLADVELSIVSQEGTLIEQGKAVEKGARTGIWIYTATAPVAPGTDIFIEVHGVDHAGNEAQLSESPTVGMDD
jgi:hypothetical protein